MRDAKRDRIVAVALLSQHDLDNLSAGFQRMFRVDDTPCFDDLLRAIDDASGATPEGEDA